MPGSPARRAYLHHLAMKLQGSGHGPDRPGYGLSTPAPARPDHRRPGRRRGGCLGLDRFQVLGVSRRGLRACLCTDCRGEVVGTSSMGGHRADKPRFRMSNAGSSTRRGSGTRDAFPSSPFSSAISSSRPLLTLGRDVRRASKKYIAKLHCEGRKRCMPRQDSLR